MKFIIEYAIIQLLIGLIILLVKKVVLQIVLTIILQGSEFIYNPLPIEKALACHNVIILIKSFANRIKFVTNIIYFLKNGSYE